MNEKKNWETTEQYELFVTNELHLPARLVIPLWEQVVELCALEIKSFNVKNPNSFSVQRAVEVKKGIAEEEMELPSEYLNILKD